MSDGPQGEEREEVAAGAREDPARITVLGNYSGRNAGDAAILDGLLRDVTETFPDRRLRFTVPTINPRFVRNTYRGQPVEPTGLLPWNLSLKILGWPVFRDVLRADLVLVTDAILFDHRLYNPLFNYLHTMSLVLPAAARREVPVVLYNVSLGPVYTRAGRRCLRRVLEASEKVIVRDRASAELASALRPRGPEPLLGADSALSTRPGPPLDVASLAGGRVLSGSDRPLLGLNVNRYLDAFMGEGRPGVRAARFQATVASVVDRAVRELGVDVVMIQTHPADARMATGIVRRVAAREHVGIARNPPFGHRELAGTMGRFEAFVGMRTHSLILASMVGVPVAGIIPYPKSRGYLESIGFGDLALEFADFDEGSLWRLVHTLWYEREGLVRRLHASIPEAQRASAGTARELQDWLGPPRELERAIPALRPG